MSLTRKFLSGKGIDAEIIDEIIQAHTETVSGLKDELDSIKAENASLKEKTADLPELQKKLSAQEGKDYDKLKKEFDDYKAEVKRQETRSAKETAYKNLLKDAGIPEKHYAKILKYSDVDGVELDDKGKIVTAKDLMKSIREEWSDHVETTAVKGAETASPAGGASGTTMTKDQIMAIKDTGERQQAIAENHTLFGF